MTLARNQQYRQRVSSTYTHIKSVVAVRLIILYEINNYIFSTKHDTDNSLINFQFNSHSLNEARAIIIKR